ncbi:hypothetical protein NW759_008669 [Fusarium solani]|nr:hypothetical protein NW759_008669 [Fusarium solani]
MVFKEKGGLSHDGYNAFVGRGDKVICCTSSLADGLPGFDAEKKTAIYNAIEQAVLHLHRLGLVHNDLTPANIRLNGHVPFITNFASCKLAGEQAHLLRSNSFGFGSDLVTASFERDLQSLASLKEYIRGQSTQRFPAPFSDSPWEMNGFFN